MAAGKNDEAERKAHVLRADPCLKPVCVSTQTSYGPRTTRDKVGQAAAPLSVRWSAQTAASGFVAAGLCLIAVASEPWTGTNSQVRMQAARRAPPISRLPGPLIKNELAITAGILKKRLAGRARCSQSAPVSRECCCLLPALARRPARGYHTRPAVAQLQNRAKGWTEAATLTPPTASVDATVMREQRPMACLLSPQRRARSACQKRGCRLLRGPVS